MCGPSGQLPGRTLDHGDAGRRSRGCLSAGSLAWVPFPGRPTAPGWSGGQCPGADPPGQALADQVPQVQSSGAETLARSWKAQQRLHATYTKLTRRGKIPRSR